MDSLNSDNPHESSSTESGGVPDAPQTNADESPTVPGMESDEMSEDYPDDPNQLREIIIEREIEIETLRSRNAELQVKLTDREKVVQALTHRLEQAVEQLDRLHRTGADRGGKLLSGIPSEVIDEQRELINDLKAAIQHWEELQSTSAMGRFEAQLGELREMLALQLNLKSRMDKPAAGDKNKPAEKAKPAASAPPQSPSQSSPQSKSASSSPAGAKNTGWEKMKAALLGDASGSENRVPGAEPMVPGAEMVPEPPPRSSSSGVFNREIKIEIKPRPELINVDSVDNATLQQAIKDRDQHIDHLYEIIEHLKREAGMTDIEALRKQKAEMDDKLRKAEIEMSMERAKLAREAARLKHMEDELPENAPKAKDRSASAQEKPEDKGSRWSRFLGSK